jgi:hypothetical protein
MLVSADKNLKFGKMIGMTFDAKMKGKCVGSEPGAQAKHALIGD